MDFHLANPGSIPTVIRSRV